MELWQKLRQEWYNKAYQEVKERKNMYKTYYASPIGQILILTDANALLGLWLEGQKYFGAGYDLEQAQQEETEISRRVSAWLDDYFKGENPAINEIPLAPQVTEFRSKVLTVLQKIPYGQTATYSDILRELRAEYGKIGSARAVGGAIGHNPISLLIPCHRIVGSDGKLTGYAGGLDKKAFLLKLEAGEKTTG
ncbi:Methylated-DNA--protein-cysteine methyltransferase, constitutive [Streptococcus cristatus]|uniref:methylated-DNA--[protein]-cysteine S-methyltransferase n=2 Tax=Streptococcus cristatus TaxID=45634 RepID=A0A3R9LCA9_STRCR|nr:Methylated-DNA--protein-cysteine methyltransferase, constitutive [Streptococcus cristatus]RSJ80490.1 Methylated-DNA--protein-cysteine methyltransferase, constitutive [Streptococcus cristatus]RSJ84337.1 Methylated-DNA--protein-cysteine methyltransferase, constitutive [Streptococcus cristatus]RSJ86224.1 Methylated-DNA--protein-cysteine methyltransferase, constitutive [Streptococcus cristatus]